MRISNVLCRVTGALVFAVLVFSAPALAAAPTPETPPAASTPAPVATPAYEDDQRILRGDKVVSGGDFTLHSDEILRGNLIVFGANIVLQENSRVEGDVTVFGGNADVYGIITGDLTSLGGNTHLRSTAHVIGSQTELGGSVRRDAGSQVDGQHAQEPGTSVQAGYPTEWLTSFRYYIDRVGNVFSTVGGIILLTLLACAIVALFPAYVVRISAMAREQWLASSGVGLLTFVVALVATGILAITICLIPAALLLTVAVALGMLGGWSVVANMLGERLAMWTKTTHWSSAAKTAAGALIIALLGTLPVVGWLIGFLAAIWGMGALTLLFVNMRWHVL